jgi:hypothetical protein
LFHWDNIGVCTAKQKSLGRFLPKCCWCFRQPFLADIADPVALANLLNQKVRDFKNGGPTAVVPSGAPSDVEMAR